MRTAHFGLNVFIKKHTEQFLGPFSSYEIKDFSLIFLLGEVCELWVGNFVCYLNNN